jgi:diguanylate cyclase
MTSAFTPNSLNKEIETGAAKNSFEGDPLNKSHLISTIKELELENTRLEEESHIDPLTKLLNRRGYEKVFDRMKSGLPVEGGHRKNALTKSIGVIFLDIDNFKSLNDTHGHDFGDEVLKQVANSIKSCFTRPSDAVVRYGGEEMVVVLPGVSNSVLESLAEEVRLAVERLTFDRDISVTVSLGIALAKSQSEAELIIELADKSMYQAKKQGKNQVVCAWD